MRSTKLLFITSEFPPQPGGIGNHAHNVAKYLNAHNFEVTILTDTRSKTGEVEKVFDAFQPYAVHRTRRKSPIFLTYLTRLQNSFKVLKKNDLVLVSGKFPLWLGGLLSLFTSKGIFAVVHGSELGTENTFTHWCLGRFEKIIAVSNYTMSLLPVPLQKKCTVIPNGFEIDADAVEEKDIPSALRLLTVGNVSERKGQQNVIKALPQLLKKFQECVYDIVGISTEKEKLVQLAKDLNVSEAIVFHGKVSEEKKIDLLRQSTVFVMLSQPTKAGAVEGFGIAILEANALGVPAIGSVNCGIEDAIAHNVSGRLVDPKNPGEITEAVTEILLNYSAYSKNAVAWSKNFTWDTVIKKYLTVLTG